MSQESSPNDRDPVEPVANMLARSWWCASLEPVGKRLFIIILVVAFVAGGGWFAWTNWGGSGGADAVGPPPRSDAVSGLESMVRTAIDEAVALVDASPDDPAQRANLGMVFHAHDLYDAAIISYQQSLELQGEQPKIRYLLADAQTRRGSLDDAAATYAQLDAEDWSYAPGAAAYGRLLLSLGRSADAMKAFRRAERLDGTNVAALVGFARVALHENRNEDAVESYRQSLQLFHF